MASVGPPALAHRQRMGEDSLLNRCRVDLFAPHFGNKPDDSTLLGPRQGRIAHRIEAVPEKVAHIDSSTNQHSNYQILSKARKGGHNGAKAGNARIARESRPEKATKAEGVTGFNLHPHMVRQTDTQYGALYTMLVDSCMSEKGRGRS